MKKRVSILVSLLSLFVSTASALHIVPDHIGDSHFTSGPCPEIKPPDGAACPHGSATCPAFYNPTLLPAGYNSVSYCAQVPAGIGFNSPGFTLLTMQLNEAEQRAFLRAAEKVESFVTDDVTVIMEPYKVAYLDSNGKNALFFMGNEYWNPVCASDSLLPPFSNQAPPIVKNPDGSYSYQNLPETYTPVLKALKEKNAENLHPNPLIDYLPSYSEINVEWPPFFYAWQASTNLAAFQGNNFLVGPSHYYPVTPTAKPFTLCAAPAAMKMLGFGRMFHKNGHTIDDINSPQYNMNVTLPGTDGAVVIPDLTTIPVNITPARNWIYDSTTDSIENTQLPKAFYQNSANFALAQVSCADPTQCIFPRGFNGGYDLIGVFDHEINHVLGVMQSQYYKVGGEETVLAYTYGTALYLLDLFDLDSDFVVPGYGNPGIQSKPDFTFAPRNNDTYEPNTIIFAGTAAGLTPFVQLGFHDHVMVYDLVAGSPKYFPFMNDSVFNPDGDIQFQTGTVVTNGGMTRRLVFIDPNLANLPPMDVVHGNVQANSMRGTIDVDTIREYSELAAEGWNIDYSTLEGNRNTVSPLAKWYQICFDSNGVFTTAKNSQCKFSVTPADLKFLH